MVCSSCLLSKRLIGRWGGGGGGGGGSGGNSNDLLRVRLVVFFAVRTGCTNVGIGGRSGQLRAATAG